MYRREDKTGNQTLSLDQKWSQNYAFYKHFVWLFDDLHLERIGDTDPVIFNMSEC